VDGGTPTEGPRRAGSGARPTTARAGTGRAGARRWWLSVPGVAAAALALAACGSTGKGAGAAGSTTTASTGAAPSGSSGGGTAPYYEVRTGTVKGLGTVLVDGQGLTLYMFVPDKQSGTSTCYGACAQAWPPLLLPAGASTPVAGTGVQASLLGTTRRTDGRTEITYDKWPLYLWQSDSQPGQATGQAIDNLGGYWYVLSPAGKVITTKPSSP